MIEASRPQGGPQIRLAEPADSDALAGVVAAFRDHLQVGAPTDLDLRARLPNLIADPSIEFAVAEFDGRMIGYTQTRFYASLWASGVEALLEDLFVLPSARGAGIGRSLLRHALERARGRGARVVGLTTNERNEPAQALYRSEGFQPQSARIWENGREIRWLVELGADR
jgi:GNAT superfamily N-acetyltransferase